MATEVIADVNQKIISSITNIPWLNVLGWLLFIAIAVGGGFWVYTYWKNKKLFNKEITILEPISGHYNPTGKDIAKTVKIGTGGFEILYLKKQNIFRIGYGGRIGKNSYYFFIGYDGIWYNGLLSADIYFIDKTKGIVPVVTTNPSMRAQYTSLEKQIDTLHSSKKTFMEQYGMWVLGAGFIMIVGVFAWLIFREISPIMGQVTESARILGDTAVQQGIIADKFTDAIDKLDVLLRSAGVEWVNNTGGSGLIPVA